MGGRLFFNNVIFKPAIGIPKKGNVEWHKSYETNFPLKIELRKRKVNEPKSQLSEQQSFFLGQTSKVKAATEASFGVSHSIVKHSESFQDGEMIK